MNKTRRKRTFTLIAAAALSGAFCTAVLAQTGPNQDITQGEIARFNNFLDSHPHLSQRLAANPGLVNDPQFMAKHPGLQGFLANHPGVREELHVSPGQFMQREGHYEWAHGGGPIGVAPGAGAAQVARFDNGYLDEHPEVARQLAANPALADNPQFLASHPGLQSYLASHPGVRQELQQRPYRFMGYERRDDRDDRWDRGNGPHPLANTDRYLDQHPEVAEQLNRNPRLVDNPQYVANHPGLREFLARHPVARAEWKSHPDRYMHREDRYDQNH